MSDTRILRERHAATVAVADRLAPFDENGSLAMLAQTKAVAIYPSVAAAFYACSPLAVDGPEIEGAAAAFTADGARTIYAYNLGAQVPPMGSKLILHACGGRWTFRYDG